MNMRITNRMMVDLAVQRMNTRIGEFERSPRRQDTEGEKVTDLPAFGPVDGFFPVDA